MMAIESPTAARVASTAASPSSSRAGSTRIFSARKPSARRRSARLGPGSRREQHPARRVGRDAVERATEERRDGQPGDLAREVPQRDLERPVAPGMEVDRLQRPDVARDGQRILAEEQVLERLEAIHRVARPDAHDALVGLDPHDA